jgi:hypothetical protein
MTKASTPLPGTVFTPRGVRILKIAVAVMTLLLIVGIGALFYGVTLQLSKLGEGSKPEALPAAAAPEPVQAVAVAAPAGAAPYARVLDLGPGKLEAVTASGNLVILHWKGEGSDVVLSVDPRNGNEIGRIQVPRR